MDNVGVGIVDRLRQAGVTRGDPVGLALIPGVGLGLSVVAGSTVASDAVACDEPVAVVGAVERELAPRWVMWSSGTASTLVAGGLRVARCWDIAAVQRLIRGGWRADPGLVWAELRALSPDGIPAWGEPDLFTGSDESEGEPDEPIRPDGHLRPDWVEGGWSTSPGRLARWAELAMEAAAIQQARIEALPDRPKAASTARSESTAELLCAELACDGLPFDRATAEEIVAGFVGPRPRSETEAAEQRAERDAEVLRHAPPGGHFDLRSPGQVKSLLRFIGIEVPDTRAWRLEALRDAHPLVEALLVWRRAERTATTFGYAWLDENVGADGRLRGTWSGCDGAAGRMTASAGLHNMPAEMRGAVLAGDGSVFVRADLGQIEPRVLAAISGDPSLARATLDDDMYALVAEQLGVERAVAKVAVLGAMYGQTTGHGAEALRGLQLTYPVAIEFLEEAARAAQGGRDLRTYGGRLVRMGGQDGESSAEPQARSRAAARGRYGRNAMVQGAAAELFKVWALTVRVRAAQLDARIVLCLHDELLVHAPEDKGDEVARVVDESLQEAAHRWTPDHSARFVSDTSVISCWADAKG